MTLPARSRRIVRSLRQFIPSGVKLGRRSAGSGPVEFLPLDESVQADLDAISSVRGSILYRGANGWAALPPGTAGEVLHTNGAGADPTWDTDDQGGGGSGGGLNVSRVGWEGVSSSGVAAAFKGVFIVPEEDISISEIYAKLNTVSSATYKAVVCEINSSEVIQTISSSSNFVAGSSETAFVARFNFSTAVDLTAGTRYAVLVGRTDGGDSYVLPIYFGSGREGFMIHGLTESDVPRIADANPAVSDTITSSVDTSNRFSVGIGYSLT